MQKWLFFLFLIIFVSCTDNTVLINDMRDLPNAKWKYDEIPDFSFTINKTNIYYQIDLKLKVYKDYPFENLYLLSHIKDPEGKSTTQRFNFTLADITGTPTGTVSGNSITYELPLITSFKAAKPGVYFIALEQNMRDSVINGVQSIGVKVKDGKPIF